MTFKTSNFIKCTGVQIEKIDDRYRLAFVRCPKCRRYVNIYKDELRIEDENGYMLKDKKCSCGLKTRFILEGWNKDV